MRCLEKARSRRYETANSLALDVQRHLEDEPVLARPPGRLYLLKKSIRRHKLGFAAGLMVAAALAAGLAIAAWQYSEKSEALERTVEAEAEQSRLRKAAETQTAQLRLRNYASDMNSANRALQIRDFGQARRPIDRHRPVEEQQDLRGWEWRYIWQQAQGDATAQLASRGSQIIALSSSPDGRWLATGTAHEGGLLLIDLEDPATTITLAEDTERVQAVFSPTDPLLVFTTVRQRGDGRRESTLHVWDTKVERIRSSHALEQNHECVGLAMARDGKSFLTSTSNKRQGTITLWQLIPELHPRARIPSKQFGRELSPQGFAATPDLRLAAYSQASLQSRKFVVIDLSNPEEAVETVWEQAELPQYVNALAFSPDGSLLAVASFGDPDIQLWDVQSARRLRPLEGHEEFVAALEFTPDGKHLLSGGGDRTLGVWDVATGRRLDTLVGHEHTVWRVHLLPDQHSLISGCRDGTILRWDLNTSRTRRDPIVLPVPVKDWRFAAGGKSIVTIDEEKRVSRWSGDRFHEQEEVLAIDPDYPLSSVANFSEDGRHLVTTSPDGECTVIDLEVPDRRRRFGEAPVEFDLPAQFVGSEWLRTPSLRDQRAEIWRVESGERVLSVPMIPSIENTLYHPTRHFFMQFAFNERVRLVPLDSEGTTDMRLGYHEASWSAAFSPDGRMLVIPSYLGYARVWDTTTWKEITTLDGFLLGVNSAGFSPNGRRLAVGGEVLPDESLRLFDTSSWEDVLTLRCDGAHFMVTRFSPDGNTLGTKDSRDTLTIWQAPTWEEIDQREAASPGWIGHADD